MKFSTFIRIPLGHFRLNYLMLLLMLIVAPACHYGPNQREKTAENVASPINTRFNINQREIELVEGYAQESAAPHSASKITTQVWGSPTIADVNADGQQDAVLILSQNVAGSGIFYYLVVATREGNNYQGGKGFLLGDRIQPQDILVHENRITVQFLDRLRSDAFSTPVSIPTEQILIYDIDTEQLIEVEQNFAGEADPSIMTLGMKTWYWEKTQYNNDSVLKPTSAKVFSLTFETNGKVLINTDCNTMQGEYSVTDQQITFSNMLSTRMFCADSQEQEFSKMLTSVSSYFFTGKGRLILELKYDSGSMTFW